MSELVRMGERAVPALLEALQAEHNGASSRSLLAVYALGQLKQAAAPAVPALLELLEDSVASGRLDDQILWSLSEISPRGFTREAQDRLAHAHGGWEATWVLAHGIALARARLGESPANEQLTELWTDGRPCADWIAAARAVRDRLIVADSARAELRRAHRAAVEAWRRAAVANVPPRWQVGALHLVAIETSHALLETAPELPESVMAAAYLLSHHDADVRVRAAMLLRARIGDAEGAEPYLSAALEDTSPRVVREAIVAVDLLESSSWETFCRLDRLARTSSGEIERLARQARRRVEERRATARGASATMPPRPEVPR